MSSLRNWNVLSWNVGGINSPGKWSDVRAKIDESSCSAFCFQETNKADFDSHFLRNFAHRHFNKKKFVPAIGSSGGLLDYRRFELWLIVGDFNLLRSLDNRNKPGGNVNDMLFSNEVIQRLGLIEIPLKGRNFTWSNMQDDALLQKLDWVFMSAKWSLSFLNTLARLTLDLIPCSVQIALSIPRALVFRFENYWVEFDSFLPLCPLSAIYLLDLSMQNGLSPSSSR